MIDKVRAAIMAVIETSDVPVHRTRLVKLIYLADNLYYEHFGETITGLRYMWDNFGPNAISDAIVIEAGNLVQDEYTCMKTGTSMYGSESYLYSMGPKKMEIPDEVLSPFERHILLDTVNRFKGKPLGQVVAASKKTKPFREVGQYEVLDMSQSSDYQSLLNSITSDNKIMSEIKEAVAAGEEAEGMLLQEVKQKYGLSMQTS
ncbi:Panacea domain-containing protein [Chloroflexota bacterium]